MTAQLVQFHDKLAEKGDKSLQFLLVSHDFNAEAQAEYVAKSAIKFPVVKFGLLEDKEVDEIVRASKLDVMPYIWKVGLDGEIISSDQEAILKELSEKAG